MFHMWGGGGGVNLLTIKEKQDAKIRTLKNASEH